MFNKLLKLSMAFVCMLPFYCSLSAGNSHLNTRNDNSIVSYDSTFIFYKVGEGEHLNQIAGDFDVPLSNIIRANEIHSQNATLYVGQILKIPSKGRSSEILRNRKKRLFPEEVLIGDNQLNSLNEKIKDLHFQIDSFKSAIRKFEAKEVLDKSIDENNMKEMLKQMERAKKIGVKKKKYVEQLDEVVKHLIAAKREFHTLVEEKNIDEEKVNAVEKHWKSENAFSPKNEINNSPEKKSSFIVKHDPENDKIHPTESSQSVKNANTGVNQIALEDTDSEKQNIQSKPVIRKKEEVADTETEVIRRELETVSKFKVKEGPQLDFETRKTEHEVLREELKSKNKPNIRKFIESADPVNIGSLESKYESHITDESERQNEIKQLVMAKAVAQSRESSTSGDQKERTGNTAKKYNSVYLSNSANYEKYKKFHGLSEVDISSELDSMNLMKSKFLLARALNEIDHGQYKKANKFIQKSLRLSPYFLDAKVLLADLHATFGYYDKAIKYYDDAIEISPTIAQLYYNRAHSYLNLDKKQQALHDFSKAIDINRNYILAYAGKAAILIENNDYESAIKDYSKILEVNNYFLPAYQGRGIAYMKTGEFEKAINDFNIILELSPKEAVIYYERGLARILSDDLYEACYDLWTATELGYKEAEKTVKRYCD